MLHLLFAYANRLVFVLLIPWFVKRH